MGRANEADVISSEKMTTVLERGERAQRRTRSREQSSAATRRKPTETLTVETDDGGGTVTLEADEIRVAGDTPLGGQGGTDNEDTPRNEAAPGSNERPGTLRATTAGTTESTSGRAPGGDDERTSAERATSPGAHGDVDGRMSGNGTEEPGTGRGQTPPREPARPSTTQRDWTPQQPIVVREKAMALKITNLKCLDDTMPVPMWLRTVRAEVRRQAVTLGVQWRDDQLYHEVAAHLEGEDLCHGYGVGLETAMEIWDKREAIEGRGPLVTATEAHDQEQLGRAFSAPATPWTWSLRLLTANGPVLYTGWTPGSLTCNTPKHLLSSGVRRSGQHH
ncbi:unnamed protein product [Phytophthora fragariaefolia]|uniref:Unnamed protein product n=1 Tax=Phytophthora fragariaefolia TaxID=1490495 RepID=A0A9W6XXT6_9STRA|nr:unnamed protein product [Phytophthora fragariaefolia]